MLPRLPEKTRKTLEKIVANYKTHDNVSGLALFGSWARGDSVPQSDVDLLVLDKSNIKADFIERLEVSGLLVDMEHVPKKWIHGVIPPELDQKLYEMQILYDRDWSLTNVKLLVNKAYTSPERVQIRTEAQIVESDVYLSRATSALARDDFKSAQLFATVAYENLLKIVMHQCLEPVLNTHFFEHVEMALKKRGMHAMMGEYVRLAGFAELSAVRTKTVFSGFKTVWEEVATMVKLHGRDLEKAHFGVRTKLLYFLNPCFLEGMLMRVNALADSGFLVEAAHFSRVALMEIVENYVWLKAQMLKVKADPSTLIRCVQSFEERNPKMRDAVIEVLDLADADKAEATASVHTVRERALTLRKERKASLRLVGA